jgi:hypothetical protein
MNLREIFENSGRIVKGVNTTVDVGPDEIKTQAAKFGNTVDKDGYPPTHKRKVKGSSTNVLFNLGEGKFRTDDVEEFKPANDALNDRKTAKNSSGEKQRMAHWMANMKLGKKK